MPFGTETLGVLLLLKAFAGGSVALTGVEAIANGVPAFKPPEAKNAANTMTTMAILLGILFIGLTVFAVEFGLRPTGEGGPSIVAMAAVAEIRFHTLVLADGDTQSITTDALFREGDSVGRKASARIGASAAGGAIIGAIFGGEKGAAIGAAAGAGAGTAVTATQKPSEARFRAGSVVTVRLTAPVSITVQQ